MININIKKDFKEAYIKEYGEELKWDNLNNFINNLHNKSNSKETFNSYDFNNLDIDEDDLDIY